MKLEKHFSVSS